MNFIFKKNNMNFMSAKKKKGRERLMPPNTDKDIEQLGLSLLVGTPNGVNHIENQFSTFFKKYICRYHVPLQF